MVALYRMFKFVAHLKNLFMSRLISKNCCFILLFVIIVKNNVFSQTPSKPKSFASFVVCLAGKNTGRISINELREVKSLDVSAPFNLIEFTIIINDFTSSKGLSYYIIKNNDFSKVMLKEIEARKNGFTLILDEIKAKDENGNIRKLPPEVFNVVVEY